MPPQLLEDLIIQAQEAAALEEAKIRVMTGTATPEDVDLVESYYPYGMAGLVMQREEEEARARVAFPEVPPDDWWLRHSREFKYTTLMIGDKGDSVRELQRRLNTLNYYRARIDGWFGPVTERAVKDFQSSVGLPPSGIADPATQEALLLAVEKATRGEAIKKEEVVARMVPVPTPPPPPRIFETKNILLIILGLAFLASLRPTPKEKKA